MGDIVHALPVLASLRATWPQAEIDWLVSPRHAPLLALASCLDARIVIDTRRVTGAGGWLDVIRRLRARRYDTVLDVQGLIKSAVLARATGAAQVVGFDREHAREGSAAWLYSKRVDPGAARHVVDWNLAVARGAGVIAPCRAFPLTVPVPRPEVGAWLARNDAFVLLNPGAAWPNKRWVPERFGAVAAWLAREHGLPVFVLWGPGERELAATVCAHSDGAAQPTPETTLEDLVVMVARTEMIVSGDTGPLHVAAALGRPIVGIFGPTDPLRNGPVSADDISLSRRDRCECFHLRACRAARWCLEDLGVEEVQRAVSVRLATARSRERAR